MIKILSFIVIALVLSFSFISVAGAVDFNVKFPGFPNLTPPGATGSDIGLFIKNLFTYAIGFAGILAVGSIVIGAIYWSLSGGSPDKQKEAKSYITSALWGILLLFGSYIILRTINPRLVALEEPRVLPLCRYNEAGQILNRPCTGVISKEYQYEDQPIPNEAVTSRVSTSTIANSSDLARTYCLGIQGLANPSAVYPGINESILDVCYVKMTDAIRRCNNVLCPLTALGDAFPVKNDQCRWWKEPSNCQVNPLTKQSLSALKNMVGPGWRITEAFPPTTPHISIGHYNGCSVDVAKSSFSSCEDLQNFVDKAIQAGFNVYNEYQSLCPNLKCPSNSNVVCDGRKTTKLHFHLTKTNCQGVTP